MGKVVKGIGKVVGGVLKPVTKIAAPIVGGVLGGPAGAAAGAGISDLLGGGGSKVANAAGSAAAALSARNQANRANEVMDQARKMALAAYTGRQGIGSAANAALLRAMGSLGNGFQAGTGTAGDLLRQRLQGFGGRTPPVDIFGGYLNRTGGGAQMMPGGVRPIETAMRPPAATRMVNRIAPQLMPPGGRTLGANSLLLRRAMGAMN